MTSVVLTPGTYLTKQQFLQKRPNGHYQNYLNFINRRRTAKAAADAAQVAQQRANPLSSIISSYAASIPTAAQMTATVNAQIKAQQAANDASIAAQTKMLEDQQARAQGYALALAKATETDPATAASQYRDAADRLRAYGTGLTGSVQAAQQAEADKAASDVSTITGGLGKLTTFGPDAVRNALQMTGVVLPGGSLEKAAADAATQAAFSRQASVANVGNIAQQYLGQENALKADIAAKNLAVAAQRPSLLENLRTGTRQDMATLISALGLQGTQAGQQSLINYRKFQTNVQKRKAKPTFDATNSRANGYKTDQYGNAIRDASGALQPLPGYKINKAGTGAVKIPSSGKGGGGATVHWQSRQIGGRTFTYNPITDKYYLPGDLKHQTPVDPNSYKPKPSATDTQKIQRFRQQATMGVTSYLTKKKNATPREIFNQGVGAKGIPGWIMAWALRKEAANHPDDPMWQDVLKPGWVAGTGR